MARSRRRKGIWSIESLKEFLEDKVAHSEARTAERFDLAKVAVDAALLASERAITAAMAAAEKAVTKAETAAEKRFDSVNEFRNAMKDQQDTFADKSQTDFRLAAIEKQLEANGGRAAGRSDVIAWIVAGVAILTAIVSPVIAIVALRGR